METLTWFSQVYHPDGVSVRSQSQGYIPGGISGSGEEYTFQGQEMMTSLPLPRSRSWVNWQSHPLDDSPPTPNVHISGILWDKVWKGIPGTGTSMCKFLEGEYKVEVFKELQVCISSGEHRKHGDRYRPGMAG